MERDTGTKAAAMNVIEFALSAEVKEEMAMFLTGDCNWIEMVTIMSCLLNFAESDLFWYVIAALLPTDVSVGFNSACT